MNEKRILGINITHKVAEPEKVQYLLSKYGCSIRTRLGLSDLIDNLTGSKGLILLELTGDLTECDILEKHLREIDGLDVQKMVFK